LEVGSWLSDEARQAVDAAFDAMSTWRKEAVKGIEQVTEKMATAARALGWPEQIVDATRAQIESITQMQNQAKSNIGCLGRADQITKPIRDVVEAKFLA